LHFFFFLDLADSQAQAFPPASLPHSQAQALEDATPAETNERANNAAVKKRIEFLFLFRTLMGLMGLVASKLLGASKIINLTKPIGKPAQSS
jgi:hypothetical protein